MKKKQLGKISISLDLRANFLLNRSKKGKTLLNLLSILTTGSLIFKYCFGVSVSNDN